MALTKKNKLIRQLETIRSITLSYFNVQPIVKLIEADPSIVLEKEWCDWRQDSPDVYPLDLSTIQTWSTHEGYLDLNFGINKNSNKKPKVLTCYAIVYDKPYHNRLPLRERFAATLQLPIDFVLQIGSEINSAFNDHLHDLYEEHLEKQQKLWIQNKAQEILLGQNPSTLI